MAMMSGVGRMPESVDASSIPLWSGSPISSSTKSIGVSSAVAALAWRTASRAVLTTATTSYPPTRARYAW